jgi:hypothetical protein
VVNKTGAGDSLRSALGSDGVESNAAFSRHLSPFATMSPDVAQQFSEGIRDPYRLMVMRIVKGLAGLAFLLEPAIAKRFGLALPYAGCVPA